MTSSSESGTEEGSGSKRERSSGDDEHVSGEHTSGNPENGEESQMDNGEKVDVDTAWKHKVNRCAPSVDFFKRMGWFNVWVLRLVAIVSIPGLTALVLNMLLDFIIPDTTVFIASLLMLYAWTEILSIAVEFSWNGRKILKYHIPLSLLCLLTVSLIASLADLFQPDGRHIMWLCVIFICGREIVYEYFAHHSASSPAKKVMKSIIGGFIYTFIMGSMVVVFFLVVLVDDRVKMSWYSSLVYSGIIIPVVKAVVEFLMLKALAGLMASNARINTVFVVSQFMQGTSLFFSYIGYITIFKTGSFGAALLAVLLNSIINIGFKLFTVALEYFRGWWKRKKILANVEDGFVKSVSSPVVDRAHAIFEIKDSNGMTSQDQVYNTDNQTSIELFCDVAGSINGILCALATILTLALWKEQELAFSNGFQLIVTCIIAIFFELLGGTLWMKCIEVFHNKKIQAIKSKFRMSDAYLNLIYFAGVAQLYLIPTFWPAGYWF